MGSLVVFYVANDGKFSHYNALWVPAFPQH